MKMYEEEIGYWVMDQETQEEAYVSLYWVLAANTPRGEFMDVEPQRDLTLIPKDLTRRPSKGMMFFHRF